MQAHKWHTQLPHLHEQVEDVEIQGEAGDDVVVQVMTADQLLSILQSTRQVMTGQFWLLLAPQSIKPARCTQTP